MPANAEVRESSEFEQLQEQSTFAEQVPYLHFPPAVPGIADPLGMLETAVNEAVLLKKDPQTALDDAASQANELLQENREKYGE